MCMKDTADDIFGHVCVHPGTTSVKSKSRPKILKNPYLHFFKLLKLFYPKLKMSTALHLASTTHQMQSPILVLNLLKSMNIFFHPRYLYLEM